MNPQIKKRWVDALRSGNYKQTTSVLRNKDEGFCCLGVLCDLVKEEIGLEWTDLRVRPGQSIASQECWSIGYNRIALPSRVYEYVGFNSSEPYINGTSLTGLNDIGFSFSKIADFIEANI